MASNDQSGISLFSFLGTLAPDYLMQLYYCYWSARAVVESLSPFQQQIVMRMVLRYNIKTPESFILSWFHESITPQRHALDSIEQLSALRIIGSRGPSTAAAAAAKPEPAFILSRGVRNAIVDHMVDLENAPFPICSAHTGSKERFTKTIPQTIVEDSAAKAWSSVLAFLLGVGGFGSAKRSKRGAHSASSRSPKPDPATMLLLLNTGLVEPTGKGAAAASKAPSTSPASFTMAHVLKGGSYRVTAAGYRFLLQDVGSYLWTFLVEYVRSAAERGLSQSAVLSLLLRLGYCEPGVCYSGRKLSEEEKKLLLDFSGLGLLCMPARQPVRKGSGFDPGVYDHWDFQPSSLASAVATPAGAAAASRSREQAQAGASATESIGSKVVASSGGSRLTDTGWVGGITGAGRSGGPTEAPGSLGIDADHDGGGGTDKGAAEAASGATKTGSAAAGGAVAALGLGGSDAVSLRVVVEKNYKVYAYTRQEAHARLIALFAEVEARLPNMVVARLTRASCLKAFGLGMTAPLIASFLTANAHSSMLESSGGSIPENVEDQLHIWEREQHRASFEPAGLLQDFSGEGEFVAVRDFLRTSGLLRFCDDAGQRLVLPLSGVSKLKAFLEQWRGAQGAGSAAGGGR